MGPSRLAFAASAALVVACAAEPPPPPKAAAPVETSAEAPRPAAQTQSEIGGLNEEAVERSFGKMQDSIQSCFAKGAAKVSALGGHFKMKLRIDPQGVVKWVYLGETTLGDRDTEKCLLDAARVKSWPLPVGGDGLAEKSFDLDPSQAPKDLDPAKHKTAITLAAKETTKCRKRGTWGAVFGVTTYLRIDGRPIAVGIAPPNEKGEEVVDCMVKIIEKIKFAGTGRKIGKLVFELR
ncbi:AgmX/PglI C-terminal domain-containing protein [Polyangium sorediatum]|uniref:AgmX/PglI C-terminal domain-containing protein n=1 Tax=Polyangium sorediatum TaxID=889274 RepID=A0ABT6P376_9BACT|nr:AgmX/PglI C-terminal domain-containing protein [Polyangium sorediatum]MDI1435059.1 AgmX/PglI C-terminal domain-containing protein [Polyangium sorediatum]